MKRKPISQTIINLEVQNTRNLKFIENLFEIHRIMFINLNFAKTYLKNKTAFCVTLVPNRKKYAIILKRKFSLSNKLVSTRYVKNCSRNRFRSIKKWIFRCSKIKMRICMASLHQALGLATIVLVLLNSISQFLFLSFLLENYRVRGGLKCVINPRRHGGL